MALTRNEAAQEIKRRIPCTNYLEKSKHGNYICPFCKSGTGGKKTGALQYYRTTNTCACFGGCKPDGAKLAKRYDVIDLFMQVNGVDYNTALTSLAVELGIDMVPNEEYQGKTAGSRKQSKKTEGTPMEDKGTAAMDQNKDTTVPEDQTQAAAVDQKEIPGFRDFFLQANKDIEKTSYHRGISLETLKARGVGYVENWVPPKAPNAPASPRLIIPITKYTYLARDTREHLTEAQEPYKKQKVKAEGIETGFWIFNYWNIEKATQPIYVVEGEIDALSIIDAGGEAIGLGSINFVGQFLGYVKDHKPKQPFIISLDNEPDKPQVQAATESLEAGLDELGIAHYRYNVAGDHKDANDFLQADRAAFTASVEEGRSKPANDYRREQSAAGHLQEFMNGIAASVNTPVISTGFFQLDYELDGGLYEGLYTIGAISSLGKTTLVMQIADQIAAAGHDVLIFSLEMARTELMAKSISRHTIIECIATGQDTRDAKTMRGITDYNRWSRYSTAEKELIARSIQAYKEYAGHIFIKEGIGNIGVQQIREGVQEHISFTGQAPVVVVDYLQILAPDNVRATDKQNTDKAVLELKRISRDYKIPVIAISSFNRMNYSSKAAMEAYKESGAIEYSSDVLLGLQLEGVGEKDFDVDKAKSENPRKIEMVILKNRAAPTGGKIYFDYYAMFNYFDGNQGGALPWDGSLSGQDKKKK